MKVLILNSGRGTRMGTMTQNQPKCLTEINNGQTILGLQLQRIMEYGIKDVVITTGPMEEAIKEFVLHHFPLLNVKYVQNPLYASTNYIYSIFLACNLLKGEDILLMHGDLVFEEAAFKKIADISESGVVISSTTALPEKDFKAVVLGDRVLKIGVEFFENAVACQPLYRLKQDMLDAWLDAIESFCQNNELGCYAEAALNTILADIKLLAIDVGSDLCTEIDTLEDLQSVRNQLRG